ncbi:PbsX family transcriptional regulator [Candidatus Marithioploca araucensis]|jgi:antitoxin MazE|uniref:PbsX family transcriptional regulator n=1 Tax=Candidatus Marithioploca araucensis TaxID=70273 RepID=A0ABT7VU02_9GAMM|nr:PbsX family transcriptional regulator [Candidatus Marithioploca araucensis]
MHVQIQKWENSLAVRIPKTFALETQLKSDSFVNMWLSNGKIIIEPNLTTEPLTLDELLAGVTDENRHHEIKTGHAVGKEVW